MLTQKSPLDVTEPVTIKSISLSNSHVFKNRETQYKGSLEEFGSTRNEEVSQQPVRQLFISYALCGGLPLPSCCEESNLTTSGLSFPGFWAPEDAVLEQMDNGDWGYMMTDPVTLNVGGHLYTTSLTTLTRYPDSMLGAMFGGDFPTARDPQGNYFIDRDGPLFRYVLNFLRTSELTLPLDFKEFDLLRKEADFYQIEPLIQCLNDPKPLYPMDTFEEVVELSSTRKLSKYSNPVAVIITQLTITTKVHSLLEGISNYFTKWNKHMMDTRDCQVSFTFGPCDYHQEVSLRVHLMEYITKQGFTIRNTRVHHMSERANENTVEHNWTFCRLARKTDD
ncbi:BTB/POZ domain-containing protein KCTD6 isoform X1 [Nannospalax galili]|uniref:BTB/POZ domain-containing protein KCTD6 isoform X1 n=1 Tax=Nannospalax galili TaxID=1026970 RepID=UPI000819F2BE|nr:BTB/POZ domain-containing protein KCTD6 isoform X1 [Nannospalax galili]